MTHSALYNPKTMTTFILTWHRKDKSDSWTLRCGTWDLFRLTEIAVWRSQARSGTKFVWRPSNMALELPGKWTRKTAWSEGKTWDTFEQAKEALEQEALAQLHKLAVE